MVFQTICPQLAHCGSLHHQLANALRLTVKLIASDDGQSIEDATRRENAERYAPHLW